MKTVFPVSFVIVERALKKVKKMRKNGPEGQTHRSPGRRPGLLITTFRALKEHLNTLNTNKLKNTYSV
jgi:hypothetical protein